MYRQLTSAVRQFLRTSVLAWIEAVGLMHSVSLLTLAALRLEHFVHSSPLLSIPDKKLVSGWAVDLTRIVPKYSRNIVSHPFSIHKLIPPFCSQKTCISSQFGQQGDIAIMGTAMEHWDDCLAHITLPSGRTEGYVRRWCAEMTMSPLLLESRKELFSYSMPRPARNCTGWNTARGSVR